MELVASKPIVEGEIRRALASKRANRGNSVLLLRAAAQWREDDSFSVDVDGATVAVSIAACPTVLSVLAAISADRADGQYLVVLTPLGEHDVGDCVLSRAIHPVIKPINRWDLVQDAFGAKQLDRLLTSSKNAWVAEALLDAQPGGGWRRLTGTVLTYATALNRLAATRLGIDDADDSAMDAAALLQWTTDAPAVASFLQLRDAELDGLTGWLAETVGPVAEVVFGMRAGGRMPDAVPFGLTVAALYDPAAGPATGDVLTARVRAEERYLSGRSLRVETLRTFGEAAESLITRWTDNGHAVQAADLSVRAERILAELASGDDDRRALAGRSRVLEAGLDARLGALADALRQAVAPKASPAELAAMETALSRVTSHGRRRDHDAEVRAAEAAVRLARWLAVPEQPPATLADAATRMLRSWGWADRCLTILDRASTSRVPRLGEVYGDIWAQARARRAALDEAFARKLASWTETGSASDLVCVENLLERIARPVAAKRAPVIVVLDGMSVAASCDLAEEITARGAWLEAGRRNDGREPALATVPSVTAISRTSLLTGTLRNGGQAEERSGFAAYWGRAKSALFHKGDLAPSPGMPLPDTARDAILAADTVVAVVLNTIDDTLDKGTAVTGWTVRDVKYLGPVLEEARRAGRPVILTADHGHVLDRGMPASPAQSDAARYRIGVPGQGEITVRGQRVLTPDGKPGGEVVAAIDETIHYTPRKAGYHGGAAPAEVVIPVITLFPSQSLVPADWYAYDTVGHAPAWWTAPLAREPRPATPQPGKPRAPARSKKDPVPGAETLFSAGDITPAEAPRAALSLGARVIASPRMTPQRQLIRRAPADASVAALIDALITAGGRITIAEAAEATGEPPVRLRSGYLATVQRMLNIDGYPVLQVSDEGRTVELNVQLLRQQFT
jgi:hypothetical protein